MAESSISKRTEPAIHASGDGARIINQYPRRPQGDDGDQAPVPPERNDGQPMKTAQASVVMKGAPLEITMGGSGAVVVRRPPAPIGTPSGQPAAVVGHVTPAGQRPTGIALVPPARSLSVDQAALCAHLVAAHIGQGEAAGATDVQLLLARSTLSALAKLAPKANE